MSVFFKFAEEDILWTVVNASPRIILASGTTGWRGNLGTSGSLSLYEGVRGRYDIGPGFSNGITINPIDPVPTHSINKTLFISGSYPATGSVQMVTVRDQPVVAPFQYSRLVTSVDWYQEHFNPIVGLFDYYKRMNTEYTTCSYDYYSMYFTGSISPRTGQYVVSASGTVTGSLFPSTALTLTAWIKPFVLGTVSQGFFPIFSQNGTFNFRLVNGIGQLNFADSYGTSVSSGLVVPSGTWSHVAITVSNGTGTFYLNGVADPVSYQFSSSFASGNSGPTGPLVIGCQLFSIVSPYNLPTAAFNGLIYETRAYTRALSGSEILAAMSSTYVSSGSDLSLVSYYRFNDGPLSNVHRLGVGSGTLDYAKGTARLPTTNGKVIQCTVLPTVPLWQPNDNPRFKTQKTLITEKSNYMQVIHIPSMFYGRQIATGSVKLVCNAYDAMGLRRVLVDDGRGRLYVSGSLTRPISREEYKGVGWNKVGNVFYNEGLIVITDPSMWDFGDVGLNSQSPNDLLQVAFSGLERITSKVFQCRVGAAQANASNNPTFSQLNLDPMDPFYGKYVVKKSPPVTWISSVGIYNQDHKLVAVAKLASPIRKRERDKLLIRLKLDL